MELAQRGAALENKLLSFERSLVEEPMQQVLLSDVEVCLVARPALIGTIQLRYLGRGDQTDATPIVS